MSKLLFNKSPITRNIFKHFSAQQEHENIDDDSDNEDENNDDKIVK